MVCLCVCVFQVELRLSDSHFSIIHRPTRGSFSVLIQASLLSLNTLCFTAASTIRCAGRWLFQNKVEPSKQQTFYECCCCCLLWLVLPDSLDVEFSAPPSVGPFSCWINIFSLGGLNLKQITQSLYRVCPGKSVSCGCKRCWLFQTCRLTALFSLVPRGPLIHHPSKQPQCYRVLRWQQPEHH